MRKGAHIRQVSYDSAPLRFSDHRPVYATFECRVSIINEALREAISKELYRRRKAEVGDMTAQASDGQDTEDEDLIGYDAIEPGLPPASSDRRKWWLDKKQPARAQMSAPEGPDGQTMALNANRASNPFGPSDEPDWVAVPRTSPGPSLSSISSSPYEKVMPPKATLMQAASARKPLPPDSGAKARNRVDEEARADARLSGPPPPPPPRRQGAGPGAGSLAASGDGGAWPEERLTSPQRASSAAGGWQTSPQSKGSGRSPPPVAKKPAHLAGISSPLGEHEPLPTRRATVEGRGGGQQQTTAPWAGPGPRPAGPPGRSSTLGGNGSVWGGEEAQGLAKQAAAATSKGPRQRQGRPTADLLDTAEESGEEMSGWETLQPSTRA